jgi:hypothetical protein
MADNLVVCVRDDDSAADALSFALVRDEAQVDAEPGCIEARFVAGALRRAVRARGVQRVIGASRRDEFELVVVGNHTHAVLANSPCPVAVAPAGDATNPAELSAFEAVGEPVTHNPRSIDARPVDRGGNARALPAADCENLSLAVDRRYEPPPRAA